MRRTFITVTCLLIGLHSVYSQDANPQLQTYAAAPEQQPAIIDSSRQKDNIIENKNLLLEFPATIDIRKYSILPKQKKLAGEDDPEFKPSVQLGAIVHMFAGVQQKGFSAPYTASAAEWDRGFSLYRARVLVGGQLTRKGSFFIETEIPSIIGGPNADSTKNVKVSPVVLDAQFHYVFANAFQVIAGKQLVSNNRNGLQGAAGLMANDFSFFQYPYNLFENSPLQGNFGRDLGVNFRGFVLNDKLEYRVGVFSGRNIDGQGPLRYVGRFAYNFLDTEKDYYYAGTNLGKGKTLSWAVGFDAQGSYYNLSTDVYFDKPLSSAGSLTINGAFQYMTGGENQTSRYTFSRLIPAQTVQFLELGYYFNKTQLQPWVKFENQHVDAKTAQTGGIKVAEFNKLNSSKVFGGGLNYFFNGSGTNLRLSYASRSYNVPNSAGDFTTKSYGQAWLQLQFFIF